MKQSTVGYPSKYRDFVLGNLAANQTLSVAHGCNGHPEHFQIFAECVVADAGYAVGDRVALDRTVYTSVTSYTNASRLFFLIDAGGYTGSGKAGASASFTGTSWKVIARIHRDIT